MITLAVSAAHGELGEPALVSMQAILNTTSVPELLRGEAGNGRVFTPLSSPSRRRRVSQWSVE
jgi:hypothetical protein